jgi:hypothetical protein
LIPTIPFIPSTHVTFVKVFAGAGLGFFIALAIGAAFIAVWFTQASNLWEKSEALWEGRLYTSPEYSNQRSETFHRYLRSYSFCHHHDYGRHHAQDGPRKGKVAIQAPEGV